MRSFLLGYWGLSVLIHQLFTAFMGLCEKLIRTTEIRLSTGEAGAGEGRVRKELNRERRL